MKNYPNKIGFTYFTSPARYVRAQLEKWLPSLQSFGASTVIFNSGFDKAIPEDAFLISRDHSIEPVVHFTSEIPKAKNFNDVTVILDAYSKWGVKLVIIGDRPNIKNAWPNAGWHHENLVDNFLERFIPLANHVVRLGLIPVLPPLQPGGHYWDTAFLDLVLNGLIRRKLDPILEKLALSGYGYTFNKSLSWGKGGPERWATSKPYYTPDSQEDQIGFHNFEWLQAVGQSVTGKKMDVFILDAGHPGSSNYQIEKETMVDNIGKIVSACCNKPLESERKLDEMPCLDDSVKCCSFSLDTLERLFDGHLLCENIAQIFGKNQSSKGKNITETGPQKLFSHYLLLPAYKTGVSDVVLSKVRPIIKKFQPTIGFSLEEAILAHKVTIFPDSGLFPDEKINQLRLSGCVVEVLPESGIEIATSLQGS